MLVYINITNILVDNFAKIILEIFIMDIFNMEVYKNYCLHFKSLNTL